MYPQIFGKYVLERELARGGMARVVLATLRGAGGFEKKLVVKQIRDDLAFDQEWVRRFVDEAKTTVSLSHPNIVPVYELGVEQGTYFLAMELVEGATVAELLKTGGPLTPEEGAYVGVEVCRALDYAHRRMEVVHRDVTPRNVMIDEEGQVKVIDFGIAAPSHTPSDAAARGRLHEVFGSPGHMPPEQLAGAALGPSTDLFAVAVMLMETWSGRPTFRRKTQAESMEAMRAPHPLPSAIDIRLLPLDDVLSRAMSLDPVARPQQAEELGRALRKFLSGTDTADLARAVGERVRAARARAAEQRAEASEASVRPRSPSAGELGTRTFAARREVKAWSRSERPPKIALPTPATPIVTINPGTRPLPPSAPPPAMEPSPDHAGVASSPPEAIETIATAPLARPIPARPERSRLLVAGLATCGALAATLFALRTQPVPRRAPSSLPVPSSPAPPPSLSPSPSLPASTPPVSSPSPSTSPAVPTTPPARLSLIADPETRVSIDGTPRGHCPVRDLSLEPGLHEVRFTFEPTGESRGQRVTLRSGERITVRADFSSATPTIRIER